MSDASADFVLQRFKEARTKRTTWEAHWQDIKELVRPDTADFNRQQVGGSRRYDCIYDGTAIDANEELAGGLHSYLTSPTERWFELGIQQERGVFVPHDDPDALMWLEQVADLIYEQYAIPSSQTNTSLHEGYLDLGAFGSMVLGQEWSYERGGQILFKSYPLGDCYYMENNEGLVDVMFRYFNWSGRNIEAEFPGLLPEKIGKLISDVGGRDKEFRIIHHIYPRTDRDTTMRNSKNKKFASCWVAENTQELLHESGYDDFPYLVSRWLKISGETYGRGPAMKCLPDIKSLNMMEKTLLKAWGKAVDPPLVIPDDGFLLPIKTSPGSLIFKEPGSEEIQTLKHEGDMKFGIEYPDQKREYIRRCFCSDWLKMGKEDKQMTAYETADRRDEKLRLLAPMLGRQQTELLGPMVARTFNLLRAAGRIPPSPMSLQKRKLSVIYTSPAARAQQGVKSQAIAQYMQDLVPLAQVTPDILDAVDMDKLAQVYAETRGVPRGIMRDSRSIATMRDQRKKLQTAQQMADIAEPATKSMLNVAQANQAGGNQ